MANYYLYFTVLSILLLSFIVISFLLYRLTNMLKRKKRLTKFSITTFEEKQLSFFEKLESFYSKIIKKISSILKKSVFLVKISKKYEKYTDQSSFYITEAIDMISNKIMFGFFCILIAIIIDALRFKTITLGQICVSFLVGYFIINIYLFLKRKSEEREIENDLLKAVTIMNNAFKSGRSIMQAVYIVSEELDGVIGNEFRKMYIDLTYGLSIDVVFNRFSDRIKNDEIKYMTASLVILNKTGGNIVKIFNTIEKGFFDRRKLKDELNSSLALSNLVYKVLIFLPIVMIIIIYLLNPTYFDPLFKTSLGKIIILMVLIIYITYIIVVKQITKLKE